MSSEFDDLSQSPKTTVSNVVTEAQAGGDQPGAPSATGSTAADGDKAKPKHKVMYIDRFRMTTISNPGGQNEHESSFILAMYRGNPRFIIRTNDPQDQENNYGRLVAAFDPTMFEVAMDLIEDACNSTTKVSYAILNSTLYKNGQKLNEPEFLNKLIIGRTEDGRIWFTIQEGSRPTPRFVFGPPKFHSIQGPDGQILSPAEASVKVARNMIKAMRGVVNAVAARFLMGEEEEDPSSAEATNIRPSSDSRAEGRSNWNGGGGNRGNWNNNRGGGNNWQGRGGNGGGWNRNGGGGGGGRGNWNGGGNRGNWNNGGGGGNRGNWNNQNQGGASSMADADIPL